MSSIVYNMDCMEGMKQYPDKYFDLAIVDPPYGAGLGEGGGCQGWFAKYREDNQPRNNGGGHQILEQVRSTIRPMQTSNGSAEVASTANITVKVHYQGANSKRNGQWVFPKCTVQKILIGEALSEPQSRHHADTENDPEDDCRAVEKLCECMGKGGIREDRQKRKHIRKGTT